MENQNKSQVQASMMLVYLIIFSIVMLFGAFISAYLVSSTGQYWVRFKAPDAFWISNGLLICSSLTMYLAHNYIVQGVIKTAIYFLLITLLLSLGFGIFQYNGWRSISELGGSYETSQTDLGEKTTWNNAKKLMDGEGEYNTYGEDYVIRLDGDTLNFEGGVLTDVKGIDVTSKVERLTNNYSGYLMILIVMHMLHLVFGMIFLFKNLFGLIKTKSNDETLLHSKMLQTYWHFIGGLWFILFYVIFYM